MISGGHCFVTVFEFIVSLFVSIATKTTNKARTSKHTFSNELGWAKISWKTNVEIYATRSYNYYF